MRVLGVDFFDGNVEEAIKESQQGGLVVAPSGPGLASDLPRSLAYKIGLTNAKLVLPDSGLLCLWLKFFGKKGILRISGLEFLKSFLDLTKFEDSSFWVMPNKSQANANIKWVERKYKCSIKSKSVYHAPIYPKTGFLEDQDLLARIKSQDYSFVFIQLGGGVQERLGLYLQEHLNKSTTILCTGAALAFLSGQQIRIPKWADKYYLGWLIRCMSDPIIFVPRYLSTFRLFWLLFRYGEESPFRA